MNQPRLPSQNRRPTAAERAQRAVAHRQRSQLPSVVDVRMHFGNWPGSHRIELITKEEPTPEVAAAARAVVFPALNCTTCPGVSDTGTVVWSAFTPHEGEHPLDFQDPAVRSALATIISILHGKRLERYARRCLRCRNVEDMVVENDLVQDALVLLLRGKLEWHGSLERMLSTLCATINNL